MPHVLRHPTTSWLPTCTPRAPLPSRQPGSCFAHLPAFLMLLTQLGAPRVTLTGQGISPSTRSPHIQSPLDAPFSVSGGPHAQGLGCTRGTQHLPRQVLSSGDFCPNRVTIQQPPLILRHRTPQCPLKFPSLFSSPGRLPALLFLSVILSTHHGLFNCTCTSSNSSLALWFSPRTLSLSYLQSSAL